MSLDHGQERIARKAVARGLPVAEVARVVGVHKDEIEAIWPKLAPQEIGRRIATTAIKPEYGTVGEFAEGASSVWTPNVVTVPRRLTCRAIAVIVAAYYDDTVSALTGPIRRRPLVYRRMMAMVLCRDLMDESLPRIGRVFNRDHTTVMHGVEHMRAKIAAGEGNWRADYEALRSSIAASFQLVAHP